MKNANPLKIAKYTFGASFGIGNLFLFGFLLGVSIQNEDIAKSSALFGFLYLFVATAINLLILLTLLIWGIIAIEKRKQCFIGIGIMLINIPLSILYAFLGFYLLRLFNFLF